VGKSEIEIALKKSETSLTSVLDILRQKFPSLSRPPAKLLDFCSVAVNEEYVLPSKYKTTNLCHRDEVALIPPVSGG